LARPKSNPQIVLRPQDLVVMLRLALEHGPAPTYATLAAELGMTASEVHGAVERAMLRGYLADRFRGLLAQPAFMDALPGHLPGDAASQERLPELLAKLREIAGLQSP
jgi:hypothetical protein